MTNINTFFNKYRIPFLIIINIFFVQNKVLAEAENKTESNSQCQQYVVEDGESILSILRKLKYYPIYGKTGYLVKTRQLNPNLPQHNYHLQAGEQLCLPLTETEDQQDRFARNSFHSFFIEGGLKYLRLIETEESTNTSAKLLSRPIASGEAGLQQNWSHSFKSFAGINYMISEILQSDTNVVIGDSIIRLVSYFVGGNLKLNEQFYSELIISYGDILVVRALSENILKMEKMSNTKLKILGGMQLLNWNELYFKGELAFLLNSTFKNEIYDAKIGKGFEGALLVTYPNDHWELQAKTYYSYYTTEVPPVLFEYTEIGLLLKLTVALE